MQRGIQKRRLQVCFVLFSLREQRSINNMLFCPACSFFMISHCSKHINQILIDWMYAKKVTFYSSEKKIIQQRVGVQETIPFGDRPPTGHWKFYPVDCIWLRKLMRAHVFTELKTQNSSPEESQIKFLSQGGFFLFSFLSKNQIQVI